ncbi:MAG TPA: glycoside hydrolase family 2 TIM barrel-domain containing protein, partial [Actinoplanes sp.]
MVLELPMAPAVRPDVRGLINLDGVWDFHPGDHDRAALDGTPGTPITVPGLWEAQGHLDLDGPAWYRRRFRLPNPDGCWTLRFDAVMDIADVYLNGVPLGRHEHPFTPFEFDVTQALVPGENLLEVRVVDPPVTDPEHPRLAHGKQGWANHVFPSRPSLYLTYGGIWQSVTLRRHGAVVIDDVFVDGDPADVVVTVDLINRTAEPVAGELAVRALGKVAAQHLVLDAGEARTVAFYLGVSFAERWSPDGPTLHHATVDMLLTDVVSDHREVRFGLRTVRMAGDRIEINGEPYRMKSVLVQGFDPVHLYAEGGREQILREVRAARDMGFNTMRLHIKAFDPLYLDVCDEEGMLLHCDLPIAEPIAHAELGDGTVVSTRAVQAIREQVRRDRNHPSVVLWSAMNELGLDGPGSRETAQYAQFARTLYAAVRQADPTRPVIENDWVEPDPDRVFSSPILTAHWYGRLHAEYLDKLERQSSRWSDTGRPFFVTEFGDWGLPMMPQRELPPFWDPREIY